MCVCVIYPNQATHQAQAVLDHLSHLYPRPVGYPQRGKGVPFSEPSAKEEGGSTKIVSFTRSFVTPWVAGIGEKGVAAFSRPLEKEGSTGLESIPMCVQKFFELFYQALEL